MKTRILIVILALVITSIIPLETLAENSFFSIVEATMNEITDCSEKQFIQLSASGYDPSACVLSIDFTEGNYSIVAVDGETAMLVYPFEREELADCIVELLIIFNDIEGQLPAGRYLQYDLKLAEDETHHITQDTLYDFISMLMGAGENGGNSRQKTYDSPIPFENLEFSNFLYEEYPSGNANISGMVKNHNNYTVDGYFYILFYKNDKLVHTELSGLPTIPAGGTGVWSDIIYGVEYDYVEYADSNVILK